MRKQRARVLLSPPISRVAVIGRAACRMQIPEPAGIVADGALADPAPAMGLLHMFPGAPDVFGSLRIRHVKPDIALRGLPVALERRDAAAAARRDPSGGLPLHVHGIGGRHPSPDAGHLRKGRNGGDLAGFLPAATRAGTGLASVAKACTG